MEVGRERGAWTVERLITAILSTRDWAFMRTISEMYGVGSVAHLPKTILSQLKAAPLRSDDAKYLITVEALDVVNLPGQRIQ